MMIHLIKKDFLLTKKYLILTMFFGFIIPILYSLIAPILLGFPTLVMSVLLVGVLLVGNAFIEEEKYPKAEMLLCSTPYTKRALIIEKYIFTFLVFIYCCITYKCVSLILPSIFFPDFKTVLEALLIYAIFWGFSLPLQYKFGIQSTKIILSLGICVFPVAATFLRNVSFDWMQISMFGELTDLWQSVILIIIIILVEVLSFSTSSKIYMRKEF